MKHHRIKIDSPEEEQDLMEAVVKQIPAGIGVKFDSEDKQGIIKRIVPKDLGELAKDTSQLHLIANGLRKGVAGFVNDLEMTHYNPKHGNRNDAFGFIVFNWINLHHYIISIPIEDKHLAESLAKKSGCRFSKSTIAIIGTQDPKTNIMGIPAEVFPMEGETVFHIYPV